MGIAVLKNSSWLNVANAYASTAPSLDCFLSNMLQNYFGLYLSMSGIYLPNAALATQHADLYSLNFVLNSVLSFPCARLACIIARFAMRQSSVNHGANVFPHLFGLRGYLHSTFFTTPAVTAWSRRKASTALEQASLSWSGAFTMVSRAALKSTVSVCSLHVLAEFA